MASNSKNQEIIEIDDDSDDDNNNPSASTAVIDLDTLPTEKDEEICTWDAGTRKRFAKFSIDKNLLTDLMKEYLRSVTEMAKIGDYNELFRDKVFCHIGFLFAYYTDTQCCIANDYLELMEELLTFYCNLELDVVSTLQRNDPSLKSGETLKKGEYKKRITSTCKRIIYMVRVYLLHRDVHMLHVLIRMKTKKDSKPCNEVLNPIYSHFLTKVVPDDLSDDSFCRSYILFQKWKDIRKCEDWKKMDEVMYKMFRRKPESIKTNDTLRHILMPPCESTADVVLQVFNASQNISVAYFRHIAAKKAAEIEDIDFNIDLGDDSTNSPPTNENEDEDAEFLKAYQEVERNMAALVNHEDVEISITNVVFKQEKDQDYGVTYPETPEIANIVIKSDITTFGNAIFNDTGSGEEPRIEDPTQIPPIEPSPPCFEVASSSDPEPVVTDKECSTAQLLPIETVESAPQPEIAPYQEISVIPYTSEMQIESCVNVDVASLETSPTSCSLGFEVVSDKAFLISTLMEIGNSASPEDNNIGIENCVEEEIPNSDSVSKSTQAEIPYDPEIALEVSRSPSTSKTFERAASPQRTNEFQLSLSGKKTRTVEVQANLDRVDKNDFYNCGFATPPSDVPADDPTRPTETCVYPNIVRSDEIRIGGDEDSRTVLNDCQNSNESVNNYKYEGISNGVVTKSEILPNVKRKFADSDRSLARISDMYNFLKHDPIINRGVKAADIYNSSHPLEIEAVINKNKIHCRKDKGTNRDRRNLGTTQHLSDLGQVKGVPEVKLNSTYRCGADKEKNDHLPSRAQIDTGQELAVAKSNDRLANYQTQDVSRIGEPHNGNTIRKSVWDSRVLKEGEEVNKSAQVLYTSLQKIGAIPLDTFNSFEDNHQDMINTEAEFADIFSSPLTSTHNNVINIKPQKVDNFGTSKQVGSLMDETRSASNSPTESSPAYESINDFGNYYSGAINGIASPRQPQSILRKPDAKRKKSKKTNQISFHESTIDNTGRTRRKRRGLVSDAQGLESNNHQNTFYDSLVSAKKRMRKDRISVPLSQNGRNSYHVVDNHSSADRRSEKDCGAVLSQYAYDPKILQTCKVQVEPLPINFNQKKEVLSESKTIRVDYFKSPSLIGSNDVVHCVSPQSTSWIHQQPNTHDQLNTGKVPIDYSTRTTSKSVVELSRDFSRLDCAGKDYALNLTIPPPSNFDTEFSNSPTLLSDFEKHLQRALQETPTPTAAEAGIKQNSEFLCENSNFYPSQLSNNNLSHFHVNNNNNVNYELHSNVYSNSSVQVPSKEILLTLPTAVPDTYDFDKNLKNDVFIKIDSAKLEKEDSDNDANWLPLKKRKRSVGNEPPVFVEEKKEEKMQPKEEVTSYPGYNIEPKTCIAEVVQEEAYLQKNLFRPFKTPAERKEMPPLPVFCDPTPSPIIVDQYNVNNHTYNNPVINYHMSHLPYFNFPAVRYTYPISSFVLPNISMEQPQQPSYMKNDPRIQRRKNRPQ